MYLMLELIVDYVSSTERFNFATERFTGRAEGEACNEVAKKAFTYAAYTIFLSDNLKTRDEVVNFRLEDRK